MHPNVMWVASVLLIYESLSQCLLAGCDPVALPAGLPVVLPVRVMLLMKLWCSRWRCGWLLVVLLVALLVALPVALPAVWVSMLRLRYIRMTHCLT